MRMIETYDMTYSQARRYCMKEDGVTIAQIARIEGIAGPAVYESIRLAQRKINIIETKFIN